MATAQALKRIKEVQTSVNEICKISGVSGLSYGISFEGEVLHTGNYGHADLDTKIPTSEDTRFFIGSLTKAFTAAAFGILVSDGKLDWDARVRDVLGNNFHFSEATRSETMSIRDILSHRMGLQRSNQMWHGNDNLQLLNKASCLSHIQGLKPLQPFPSSFHYSNWGYALAGQIIEKLTGETWGSFVNRTILEPLGMNHTTFRIAENDSSLAKPYTVLDDGSFKQLAPCTIQDGALMVASQGLQSSVSDMLKWSGNLLKAIDDQKAQNQIEVEATPLKEIAELMKPVTPFGDTPLTTMGYGMGWVHTQLPAMLGNTGCNPGFVSNMPIVGQDSVKTVKYHQGSLAGYTSSIFLVPSSQSSIVVLTNSISLNDAADWVGQLLLEALLGVQAPNDFVSFARESSNTHLSKFPAMRDALEKERSQIGHIDARPRDAYHGRYHNDIRDFFIEIRDNVEANGLELAFQGLESQVWPMEHYTGDSFLWLMSRDEAVARARFPYSPAKLYRLDFQPGPSGNIETMLYAHDADGPPECLSRDLLGALTINGRHRGLAV